MRELDVVVFGATSVTGREVCRHLEQRMGSTGVRWAAGARDPRRAVAALERVGVACPEVVVADVADPTSLAALARRATVVLNLVGPYTAYGAPVVAACVDAGTHYVDLTGETPFVRATIDRHHETAQASGAKVVQVCGFESLPPDLAVRAAADATQEQFGAPPVEVDVAVQMLETPMPPRPSDFMSGGTIQSMVEIVAGDGSHAIFDPALLVDDPDRAARLRRLSPVTVRPRRAPDGAVLAPMTPVATINPPVLHRTAELLGLPAYRYREGMAMLETSAVTFVPNAAMAAALSGLQAGMRGFSRRSPRARARVGAVLRRMLPGAGFGPATDRLHSWRWTLRVDARTAAGDTVRVDLDADGHPGYLATARVLGEVGLLLSEDGATPERAGCLTPSVALGVERLDRFAEAGLRFDVA